MMLVQYDTMSELIVLIGQSGFSLRASKRESQGLPMWSKGVLEYDSEVCCFNEVKTTAKILIILAFSEIHLNTNP